MRLISLADQARAIGVHREQLLRQVRAAEKSMRVKIVVQHGRRSKIWLNRDTLERLHQRAQRDIEGRVARLEGGLTSLDERVEALESRRRVG